MAEGTFKGRVSIHVESSDVARSHFVVHAGKPLEVKSTRVEKRGDGDWGESLGEVEVREAFWHEPREFWVMRLGGSVGKGRYRITLEFEGRLDQSTHAKATLLPVCRRQHSCSFSAQAFWASTSLPTRTAMEKSDRSPPPSSSPPTRGDAFPAWTNLPSKAHTGKCSSCFYRIKYVL